MCIDFDSYFASCEQHFNPNLRNRPIGVTATNGRTCVIAASREAKRYGVKSPIATWEAIKICPNIIFVPADFDRYLDITKKFLEICSRYSPLVEAFSLDELFLDLTPVMHLYPSVEFVMKDIKEKIKHEIGETITVSVGVSHNKLLSKLASGLDKPDGFVWITPENLDEIYAKIPLTKICGIGERLKVRLNFLGITTLFKLRTYPMQSLIKEFGPACAQHLKDISFGKDVSMVKHFAHEEVVKSVGRNYCLPENQYSQEKILQIIFELCDELALKLRKMKMQARTVGMSLAGDREMHARKTVPRYMNKGSEIFEICKMLYTTWKWNSMVRQMGIWVTNLEDNTHTSYSLFENPRQDKVREAIDTLNKKYGGKVVRNGFAAQTPSLPTKPNGFFADRYQRSQLKYEVRY
jgi:DNA polymerase-4